MVSLLPWSSLTYLGWWSDCKGSHSSSFLLIPGIDILNFWWDFLREDTDWLFSLWGKVCLKGLLFRIFWLAIPAPRLWKPEVKVADATYRGIPCIFFYYPLSIGSVILDCSFIWMTGDTTLIFCDGFYTWEVISLGELNFASILCYIKYFRLLGSKWNSF